MAGPGFFDETWIPAGWFDETADASGWFDETNLGASAAAEANEDTALAEPFRTRTSRSRRQQSMGWNGALRTQPSTPVVVPVSAWLAAPRPRRKATERRTIVVQPLQWPYIAPTVAAILPRPIAKIVWFDRHIQLPLRLEVYPPPVGPPSYYPAWVADRVRPVSQRRRLQRLIEQPAYPATSVTTSPDTALREPFQTKKQRSRKLQKLAASPSYPQAAAPSPVTVAAIATKAMLKRRKKRGGLLLGGGGEDVFLQPSTTPAAYPSFVESGHHKRKGTGRKSLRLIPAPVYPQTSAPSPTTFPATTAKPTKKRATRRGIHQWGGAALIPVAVVPPSTYPAPNPVKATKRKTRRGLHLWAGSALIPVAAVVINVYPAFVTSGHHKRGDSNKRLLRLPPAPVYPAPAAPAPVTVAAIAIPARVKRRGRRGGLLLGGGGDDVYLQPESGTTTPAVYPSFLPTGHHERRDIARRVQVAEYPPVYPVATASTSPDTALAESFQTRTSRSRKLLRTPDPLGIQPAPPPVFQYAAIVAAKAQRRPGPRGGLLLFVDAVVANVVQPEAAWRAPKQFFQRMDRKFLRETIQPQFPNIPPVTAVYPSFVPTGYIRRDETTRNLLPADVQLEFPETPPTPEPEVPVHRRGGRPRPGSRPEKRLPSQYKRLEEMVDEVLAEKAYKAIVQTAPAPVVAAAKAIVQPFRATKTAPVDWLALEADAARVGRLMALWATEQQRIHDAEQRRLALLADDDDWLMMED